MRKVLKLALFIFPAAALAGPLVYMPTNPSFGGNPLNGPNLLNQANAQNKFTDPRGSLFGRSPQTQLDLFNQRLQSLILDRIATSLGDSLFDPSGNLVPGTVETSTFLITIVDLGGGMLLVTTTDKTTGASTSFQISQ